MLRLLLLTSTGALDAYAERRWLAWLALAVLARIFGRLLRVQLALRQALSNDEEWS